MPSPLPQSQSHFGVIALASIFATRMLGMFLILPVLSIATSDLSFSTPVLAGMALGIYGLFQSLLQIPFGLLSDRYGRKPIMTLGLILFLLGSVIAALSQTIYGLIVGRALQGMGAIGSTTLAYIADLTPEDKRSQAMAIVGLHIAASFGLAILLSPIIYDSSGLAGIFWITTAMAAICLLILHTSIPKPNKEFFHRDTSVMIPQLKSMLKKTELLSYYLGIFILHSLLSACFLVVPSLIQNLNENSTLTIYAPALLGSIPIMLLGAYLGEKKRIIKGLLITSILTLLISFTILSHAANSGLALSMALLLFFSAFGLGESFLPSLVSKTSPANTKGTAMGIFSSAQFLGAFAGAYFGGILLSETSTETLFLCMTGLCLIWATITIKMPSPLYLSTLLARVNINTALECAQLKQHLLSTKGIYEADIMSDDGIAYLKFDSRIVNREQLNVTIEKWRKTK